MAPLTQAGPPLLMGIDIGAGSLKTMIVDESGKVLGAAAADIVTRSPQPGFSDQDPLDWWRAVCATVPKALEQAGAHAARIGAISFSAGAHTPVLQDAQSGFELKMRTKAEEDPVVAAASIVARAEYVRQMHALSEKFGEPLQKGAGPLVKKQAAHLIDKLGAAALGDFAKLHFRTAYEVVADAGKLDELPLRPPPPKTSQWN